MNYDGSYNNKSCAFSVSKHSKTEHMCFCNCNVLQKFTTAHYLQKLIATSTARQKEGGCTEKARESSYRHMSMNKDCQSLVLLMRPPPPGGGVFVVFFFNSWTLLLKMKSLLRRRPSAGVGDSTVSVIGAVKLYNVWCYRITCR